ncbi:MAG: hypothetical protein AYK22_07120 [Thermoplasmatales archaeon SG8-52-3]|nr:MAG: hypothetical protein AYK22_07120 [Thermoplasmatales archaeon SG8-52-3]
MKRTKYPPFKESDIIKASEIGQFCFCSISWYLQKCGYIPKSPNLEKGIKKHEELGKIIEFTHKRSYISKVISLIGYIILFFGLLFIISEVIL